MNLEVSVVYSSFPRKRRAVRGIELGCELTLVCNQRVSPWPGWTRPPAPSLRTLRLPQDVDARDKPGQGAFGGGTGSRTHHKTAVQFSPDSPARKRESKDARTDGRPLFMPGASSGPRLSRG